VLEPADNSYRIVGPPVEVGSAEPLFSSANRDGVLRLIDAIPAGVFVVEVGEGGKGFTVFVLNRVQEGLSGVKLEEVQGKKLREIFPPTEAQRIRLRFQQCVEARKAIEVGAWHEDRGPARFVSTTLVPVIDDHDRVVRIVGTCVDRTAQLAAGEQQQRLRARLRRLAQAVHQARSALDSAVSIDAVLGDSAPSANGSGEVLSPRELDVLQLLSANMTRREIAEQLFVSENTVKSHIAAIYKKLGVHTRSEAARRATELGLV
jgi:PAS domain S-box-containing protein